MSNLSLNPNNGQWQPYQGDDDSWAEMLGDFSSKGYLNSTSWGKHLSNLGWLCLRWEFSKSGSPKAYCQSFFKSYPFRIGILWIPDGIMGDCSYTSSLGQDLTHSMQLKHLYIRYRDSTLLNPEDYIKLLMGGWVKPKVSRSAEMTMSLDISQSTEIIKRNFTQSWRKTLKKSLEMSFEIVEVTDPRLIASLYLEMRAFKSLRAKEIYSEIQIKSIMKSFHNSIIVLGARDKEGNLVAIRGAIFLKDKATDIFAATSDAGRTLMASHAIFMGLINECKKKGCAQYDLNGIDPSNSKGVYNFKKGTGAKSLITLGEFEWSNNKLLAFAVNFFAKIY